MANLGLFGSCKTSLEFLPILKQHLLHCPGLCTELTLDQLNKLETDERFERLWQKVVAAVASETFWGDCRLKHYGSMAPADSSIVVFLKHSESIRTEFVGSLVNKFPSIPEPIVEEVNEFDVPAGLRRDSFHVNYKDDSMTLVKSHDKIDGGEIVSLVAPLADWRETLVHPKFQVWIIDLPTDSFEAKFEKFSRNSYLQLLFREAGAKCFDRKVRVYQSIAAAHKPARVRGHMHYNLDTPSSAGELHEQMRGISAEVKDIKLNLSDVVRTVDALKLSDDEHVLDEYKDVFNSLGYDVVTTNLPAPAYWMSGDEQIGVLYFWEKGQLKVSIMGEKGPRFVEELKALHAQFCSLVPKPVELIYFDVPGAAEKVRLAMAINGIDFTDTRIKHADWQALKPTTKFGQIPIMKIDGVELAQSGAMLRWAGRKGDGSLYPSDPAAQMKVEEVLGLVDDVQKAIGTVLYLGWTPEKFGHKDLSEEQKKELVKEVRTQFVTTRLPELMSYYVKVLQANGGAFFCGDSPTIADCAILPQLNHLTCGIMDHVPSDCLAPFPALIEYMEKMRAVPEVKAWYEKRAAATKTQ